MCCAAVSPGSASRTTQETQRANRTTQSTLIAHRSQITTGMTTISLPIQEKSLEMISRGLYHFYVARQKGLAEHQVQDFAAPENQDLGIVKQKRKPKVKLLVAPFPELQRIRKPFFFSPTR